jgi:glycosyltransferase involved in cell wall biosynthesis
MVIKISDVVIFETDILKDRAVNYKDFPDEDTYVVKMAVNKIVEEAKNIGSSNNYLKSYKDKFKILYLASSHPNKRQHLLIDIAKFFKENNENICFITTMDERKKYSKEFINKIKKNNLEDYIINLGPIDSSDVGSLINEVDAMINIAKLESFSNNFIEAWTFNKLLILTDADWSRGSCKESAIYIEPEKIIESAKKIVKIKDNHNKRNEIISTYQNRLDEYFDYKEKTKKYLEIISKYSG